MFRNVFFFSVSDIFFIYFFSLYTVIIGTDSQQVDIYLMAVKAAHWPWQCRLSEGQRSLFSVQMKSPTQTLTAHRRLSSNQHDSDSTAQRNNCVDLILSTVFFVFQERDKETPFIISFEVDLRVKYLIRKKEDNVSLRPLYFSLCLI